MITVTGLRWVPPAGQGLVKDLRVRWALEEAGLDYQVRLIGPEDQASAGYRSLQPFGQVPVYEEAGLVLFESGAIVQHIAARSPALTPDDPDGRARVLSWMFAAAASVEPFVQMYALIAGLWSGEEWARLRRAGAEEMARRQVAGVARWLADREYLEGGRFTAADLLMSCVLQILRGGDMVEEAGLAPYVARCTARPAYRKALADQMAAFAAHAPAGA